MHKAFLHFSSLSWQKSALSKLQSAIKVAILSCCVLSLIADTLHNNLQGVVHFQTAFSKKIIQAQPVNSV